MLILSYNASHSTLMTRVVVKTEMTDFVVSGAQSGVLYVSSLPVEKNVFAGVSRKIRTFTEAFMAASGGQSDIRVVNASSTSLDLPDSSIDYVFTDPPFEGFIPYAELNQINEAWLGSTTDRAEEAIVSPAQGKTVADYATLMKAVFAEVSRVMKPKALGTVVFHSSRPEVWSALGAALESAEINVVRTSLLDKTQPSFKQVVSDGGTMGDAVFLVTKAGDRGIPDQASDLASTVSDLRGRYGSALSHCSDLFTRYVAECLRSGGTVAWGSADFYRAVRVSDQEA